MQHEVEEARARQEAENQRNVNAFNVKEVDLDDNASENGQIATGMLYCIENKFAAAMLIAKTCFAVYSINNCKQGSKLQNSTNNWWHQRGLTNSLLKTDEYLIHLVFLNV